MKAEAVYFALALFCASPEDTACSIVESVQSPHATQDACLADLKEQLAGVVPEHLDKLITQGGKFTAQCLALPANFNPADHPEEIKRQLDGPSTKPRPEVEG